MAQAPTGIGKTLATVFPLLKARAAGKIDRIFFLTAKTSGRAVALDALALLGRDGARPRARRRRGPCGSTGRRCAGSRSRTRSARISSRRRWRAGRT